jgi:drug/metabolite transporter (DMT)-like permease
VKDRRAELLLLGLTAFWGASFAIVKGALDDSDPFTFLALRFALGALTIGVFARRQLLDRRLWRPAATLGVFLFLGFLTQTWGLATTTPSRSAFITGLFVVLTPFVTWAVLRRAPGWNTFFAALLAVAGLYLLSGANAGGGLTKGDALTLACAVAYAVHLVLTERYAPTLPSLPLATLQMSFVALLSIALLPFAPRHLNVTADFVAAVLAAGIVSTAGALWLQVWAQQRTSAVRAAFIIALEPVFATVWSLFRHRDVLEGRSILGGAVMMLAVFVSMRKA